MARANLLLMVTGGIAAYKSCMLTRLLVQAGFSVRVAMTASAQRFVAPLTFEVLSGHAVATDLWGEGGSDALDHVAWARWADLVVVAPATANLVAKSACGIADDIVTTLLVAYPGPLVLAPAMNDNMWRHPATQTNLATLRQRNVIICEPGDGFLACGTEAVGRVAEPEEILATVFEVMREQLPPGEEMATTPGLTAQQATAGATVADRGEVVAAASAWAGQRVVVTAGPTWEAIDPVRYIANRSTGVFGHALAAEAASLGAEVTLVTGPTHLQPPPGVNLVERVESAAEMATAVGAALVAGADWLFMSAAVADFTPARLETGKLKKESLGTSWNLEMTRSVDILLDVVNPDHHRPLQVVGFALETEDLVRRATEKMRAKGMDFIVANDPTAPDSGFGDKLHKVTLIGPEGVLWEGGPATKRELARELFPRLAAAVRLGGADR